MERAARPPIRPRLAPCPLHWDRPGGPLGYILIPRVILAKARRPIAAIIGHCDLIAPPIDPGDTVIIDAEGIPGNGLVVACSLNGVSLLRVYHRLGNGRVMLRVADREREGQIAVLRADRFTIYGVAVGAIDRRTGRAFLLTASEPIAC